MGENKEEREIREMPIERLKEDPANIRRDPKLTPAFIESIAEGIRQPLIVRPEPDGDKYLVTVGCRRFLAAKNAGLEEIPCKVAGDLEDDFYGAMAESTRENVQRIPLSAREIVEIVGEIYSPKDDKKTTERKVREVSENLGLPREKVRRYLSLFEEMPEEKTRRILSMFEE